MHSRLAQIIASSIGPDGKPDRAKIFADLSLDAGSPEAILIEIFVASEEQKSVFDKTHAAAVQQLEDIIKKEGGALREILDAHRTLIKADARSRRRWLGFAIASPLFAALILFALVLYFVTHIH